MSVPEVTVIDYHKTSAADALLPNPSILSSSGWTDLHLEVFQQPKFEIAEHQHTMHVIAVGLSGGSIGERWMDGKCCRETRNNQDIAIIPAGITHRCNWHRSARFLILAIEPILLKQIGQDWIDGDRIELIPQFMTQQDAFIQGILSSLRAEIESPEIASQLLVDSLRTTLAIHLIRHYCSIQPKISNDSGGLSQLALKQVTEYIQEHLHQELKLVDLGAIAQISSYHFLRLFKQKTGITPHQYILQQRIEKAQHLLKHSKLSIAEIALQAGFCDQSHLTRCFKRRIGVTPKQLLHDRSQVNHDR
ncbi:helix-turn-helix transcriptional regulator [Microcoleus sp. FACHB-1515]|uniref:AraC family transcriptional regulator n=1 Tax=Cyanophyceae TaxID=3028117 RepID=UPI001687F1D1|nr:AraC family transcriptional regulator [Microcoleus sp. FACHB-1515]MBD2090490.1 helix-turn-helix transcriptional regulator [Microcoleus sp. FACHB-1515]